MFQKHYLSLTDKKIQKLTKSFKDTKMQGIHIHCPEGAVPKDGPSLEQYTACIYSLLNSKKIKNNIAITGEINLCHEEYRNWRFRFKNIRWYSSGSRYIC